jgi:hypothetical protein
MDEDACGSLAQPVAADGTVADAQARGALPLRILHIKNKKKLELNTVDFIEKRQRHRRDFKAGLWIQNIFNLDPDPAL